MKDLLEMLMYLDSWNGRATESVSLPPCHQRGSTLSLLMIDCDPSVLLLADYNQLRGEHRPYLTQLLIQDLYIIYYSDIRNLRIAEYWIRQGVRCLQILQIRTLGIIHCWMMDETDIESTPLGEDRWQS